MDNREALVETADADAEVRVGYTGWVLFTVSGPELNPGSVSAILDLEPDRLIFPGSAQEGVWQLNSHLGAEEPLEKHLWVLLERILPVRRQLRQLARDHKLEFYCSVQKDREAEIHFELPSRLLLLIGYLGAGIVCDVSDHY